MADIRQYMTRPRAPFPRPGGGPACPACNGYGIVDGSPPPTSGANLIERTEPCTCPAGDQWRRLYSLERGELPCERCGRPAVWCSNVPRCAECDRKANRR